MQLIKENQIVGYDTTLHEKSRILPFHLCDSAATEPNSLSPVSIKTLGSICRALYQFTLNTNVSSISHAELNLFAI